MQKIQCLGKVLSTITFCLPKLFKHFYKVNFNSMQYTTIKLRFYTLSYANHIIQKIKVLLYLSAYFSQPYISTSEHCTGHGYLQL